MLKKNLKKVLGTVVLAVMSTMLLAGNAFAADTINPTAPTNVRVVSSTCTSVTLSWTASTDNVGIQKYTVCNVTDLETIDTGSNNTTYTVTGLQPNESYSFTVQALDTSGNGSPSSSMVNGTTSADTVHPTAPTNLTVVASTCTTMTLSWTASTDNVGIGNYTISNITDLENIDTGSNNTTYTVTGLEPNKSYSFAVQCVDTSGNGSPSSSVVTGRTPADTIHPTAPTNLTVVASTCTTLTLSWTASTDNVGIGNYTISNVTDLKNIDTGSNNTTYTVTGLEPNKSYSFAVQCIDTSGNGSPSSSMVTGTTLADTIHPTAPTNLTVVSVTRTSVTLSWTASTDNVGIKNYTISNVTDLKNIDTGSNNTTYTVTGLQPNKSYSFVVQCLDTSGNGSPSSTMITARTLQ